MWNVVYDYVGYSLLAPMSCPWYWAAGGNESIFLLPSQYKVACEQALLLGRASGARAFSRGFRRACSQAKYKGKEDSASRELRQKWKEHNYYTVFCLLDHHWPINRMEIP